MICTRPDREPLDPASALEQLKRSSCQSASGSDETDFVVAVAIHPKAAVAGSCDGGLTRTSVDPVIRSLRAERNIDVVATGTPHEKSQIRSRRRGDTSEQVERRQPARLLQT
jgi:hypothetical protein